VTWWAWTLLWIVLVAVAGLVLFLAVRRLLRQGTALAREFADVTDRLAEVTRALEDMPGDPAVAERAPAPVRHRHRHRQSTTRASSRGHR
jgi:cell division protein FtsB